MKRRLAVLLAIATAILTGMVVAAGFLALRANDQRAALRAWAPSAADHPAWAATLAEATPSWQISRPTPDSVLVEYQLSSETASLYTAAMRERDPASAALSQQAFLAAQVAAMADRAPAAQADFAVGDEAALIIAGDETVAVARAGRAVVVINTSGLPRPQPTHLATIIEARLERILAAP